MIVCVNSCDAINLSPPPPLPSPPPRSTRSVWGSTAWPTPQTCSQTSLLLSVATPSLPVTAWGCRTTPSPWSVWPGKFTSHVHVLLLIHMCTWTMFSIITCQADVHVSVIFCRHVLGWAAQWTCWICSPPTPLRPATLSGRAL